MTKQINVPAEFTAKVRGVEFAVANLQDFPTVSLEKIFAYGLQRIFNDAAASAKTDAEALELAGKRYDNLAAGIIRASGSREGNPVKRRALELAETKIKVNPAYVAWLQKAAIKSNDKVAVAKLRELANKAIAVEGNQFTAQAERDVAAQKGLGEVELELDMD